MPRVKCASIECKWNNDNNYCTYKGTLSIATWDVNTVSMGRKSFHECKMYEESEWSKELIKKFHNYYFPVYKENENGNS